MKFLIILLGSISLMGSAFAAESETGSTSNKHFRIIRTTEPVFPVTMSVKGVRSGEVRMVLRVSPEGQLTDYLLVAYSKEAFANEAVRAVKKWKFDPEYVDGTPVGTVVEIAFNFQVNGIMLVTRHIFEFPINILAEENQYDYQVCTLKNIDRIPTPVNVVNPAYSTELAERGIVGKVTVNFYIDETGKVRLPVANGGSNDELAAIAVDAVSRWQFAPPTRKGAPVLVHAQQVFDFHNEAVKVK